MTYVAKKPMSNLICGKAAVDGNYNLTHDRGASMVDEWSGLADLLASLIEKYASDLDIDKLPDIEIENSIDERVEKLRE